MPMLTNEYLRLKDEIFNRWELLADDNLNLNEIKIRFFDLSSKLLLAVGELPDYYKLFFLSQNIQMVIGALKPVTNITIDRGLIGEYVGAGLIDDYAMDDFSRVLFEYFDVKLTERMPPLAQTTHEYYIYNPSLLKSMSLKYPSLLPYEGQSINVWIEQNLAHGLELDYIHGLMYGFPISAVKQFVKYQQGESCRLEGRQRVSSYGEAYYVWGDEHKRDVMVREAIKEVFFAHLAQNTLYLQLIKELNVIAKPFRALSRSNFERQIANLTSHSKASE